MKIILSISRIIVGSLFIFSGIIKANDPLGFSYKLEEYWIEFGIGWDWLIALGTPLAAFICIFEIVLGVAILVGYRPKIVSQLSLLMIVFFTILTFASAVFGLVKTCGCFGDAIPLTPWQSFIKDVILLMFIVILYGYHKEVKPFKEKYKDIAFVIFPVVLMSWISFKVDWEFPLHFTLIILSIGFIFSLALPKRGPMFTTALSAIASIWLCFHVVNHLPMKDFRPYAVGKSISEQMKLPEGAKPDVYENELKYRNITTGEVQSFDDKDYPWDDDNYEFVDRNTTLIEKGDEAKITDFSIVADDGYVLTDDILDDPDPIVVMIIYDMTITNNDKNEDIKSLINSCNQNGISIIGLTASNEELISKYLNDGGFELSFYSTDQITLKTIVRSNPGFILLKQGTVLGKWHVNDTPALQDIQSLI